jgi:hypothetical protein
MKLIPSPCFDQTNEAIEEWLRANVGDGCQVVMRDTRGGLLSYKRGVVVRLGKGRFEVAPQLADREFASAGEAFYYSGKNCWRPKGQVSLVMPTESVLRACDDCLSNNGFLPALPWSYSLASESSSLGG